MSKNWSAEGIAGAFDDAIAILCDWQDGEENGFLDALARFSATRAQVYDLLREHVGDPDRADTAEAGFARSPFADFPEIRCAEADCGGGGECALFAEIHDCIVGWASSGDYYAIPADAELPEPMTD